MKVVTVEEMHWLEAQCGRVGITPDVLMENAGRSFAECVDSVAGSRSRRILFLIGPGNNGGDGLVAARFLDEGGHSVDIYLLAERSVDDKNFKEVMRRNIDVIRAEGDSGLKRIRQLCSGADVIVDAIFGTGQKRPLSGIYAEVVRIINIIKKEKTVIKVFALDVPTGLNANSGQADPTCLVADYTVTLGFPKIGLFQGEGRVVAGKVMTTDIGIPARIANGLPVELVDEQLAGRLLPRRPRLAYKGDFGRLMVVAGSKNYIGAAHLACAAATRTGAGLVTLATAESLTPVLANGLFEVTHLPLPEAEAGIVSSTAGDTILSELINYDAVLIGCGLGHRKETSDFIMRILTSPKLKEVKLVLDADALNILADVPEWWQELTYEAILTPHPGEMARLCQIETKEVQKDRAGIIRKMAERWSKVIALKGANTIIAAPDRRLMISNVANPALATAGTGDVLAGVVAGLLTQGLDYYEAAILGVYLHAEAGEYASRQMGQSGVIASDLLPILPLVIKELHDAASH